MLLFSSSVCCAAESRFPPSLVTGRRLGARRKRTWTRAVFTNLQRTGLEKRFTVQRYITKPERRKLADTLGLTDSQVRADGSQVRGDGSQGRNQTAQSRSDDSQVRRDGSQVRSDSSQ